MEFPISSRQTSGTLTLAGKAHVFQVLRQDFEDRIFMLLTCSGKIGQLISVPLAPTAGVTPALQAPLDADLAMLPPSHLEPKTLLGASTGSRADMSALIAVQTAALLVRHQSDERRALLMGVTLPLSEAYWDDHANEDERASFFVGVLNLVGSITSV